MNQLETKMPKKKEPVAATRNQPARRVKSAMPIVKRAPVENSPRKPPARRLKSEIPTTEANVIRRIKCEVTEVSTAETDVTHRSVAVANFTSRNYQGKF